MRISDWSSDVCSSDLRPGHALPPYSLRSESYGNPGVNAGAGLQASEILARHHAKVDTGPPKRLGMSVATFASRVFVHDPSGPVSGGHRYWRKQESRPGRDLHPFLQHLFHSIFGFRPDLLFVRMRPSISRLRAKRK